MGCAVALAPGYRIEKETRKIRFVPGEQPALAIRVDFTLRNSGNSALNFVDVRLPSAHSTGRADLRVEMDGKAVAPAPLSPEEQKASPDVARIDFKRPWARNQKLELSFDYLLRTPADSASYMTIEPLSFHLGVRGWAPQLQPPNHLLATYPSRPPLVLYQIRVPADFSVRAGGARKGRKTLGNEVEYRYELNGASLGAFAVAGRYVSWPANAGRNEVAFWTAQAITGNAADSARQIAMIWNTFTKDFGIIDKSMIAPHVVASASVRDDIAGGSGPAAVSFPGGALLNPAAWSLGIDSEQFFDVVGEALARNWFDEEVVPSAEAEIGMGYGLPEYASIVADEARNGAAARRRRVDEYLQEYDAAVKSGEEIPVSGTTAASPRLQRQIALAKAPLFYVDLEDTCGSAPVRAGLAHLLASLRGQEVDYDVLRSVLEQSTGRPLAEIFRRWLDQKGIPSSFRSRYADDVGLQESEK